MEKLLFKKVELWIVGVLAVLGIIVTIMFGNVVVHKMKGGTKAGIVGDVALGVSDIPGFLRKLQSSENLRVGPEYHQGKSGFTFSYAAGSKPEAGYLLHSWFSGDDGRAYVDLFDLNKQAMVHRWAPDVDALHSQVDFSFSKVDLQADKHMGRMIIRHPYATDDGGLIFKSYTPLYKVDACSELAWFNDTRTFHHSLVADDEGKFWVGAKFEPPAIPYVDPLVFEDDTITLVDSKGNIEYIKSVAEIFIENDMHYYVYGGYRQSVNPIHLNDIQPVLTDGPHWKRGDLFLSMRSQSLVALYRPSTNKILWHQVGPWNHQHDVDIIDNSKIAIYNNNSLEYNHTRKGFRPIEINIYDFDTHTVSSPWKAALEKHDVRAETGGLYEILPNDDLFVEETNYGRLIHMTIEGEIEWEYVNRAQNGSIYRVGWNRLIDRERGDHILANINAANCSQ